MMILGLGILLLVTGCGNEQVLNCVYEEVTKEETFTLEFEFVYEGNKMKEFTHISRALLDKAYIENSLDMYQERYEETFNTLVSDFDTEREFEYEIDKLSNGLKLEVDIDAEDNPDLVYSYIGVAYGFDAKDNLKDIQKSLEEQEFVCKVKNDD